MKIIKDSLIGFLAVIIVSAATYALGAGHPLTIAIQNAICAVYA